MAAEAMSPTVSGGLRGNTTTERIAMTEPTTRTIDAPGATIAYDVREADGESDTPILMLIGSPMDAGGFATLSEHFRDRTVVTYDPRGVSRSTRTNGADRSTPDEHADDVHRVLADLGAG